MNYFEASAYARACANQSGFDHGIERDTYNGPDAFYVFMLPRKQSRCGHELRCEVVSCDNVKDCQRGHGPGARVDL